MGVPVMLFNEGLMPPGPPASEPQMADAESLHKVGCSANSGLVGLCFWRVLCFCAARLMPKGRPPASRRWLTRRACTRCVPEKNLDGETYGAVGVFACDC